MSRRRQRRFKHYRTLAILLFIMALVFSFGRLAKLLQDNEVYTQGLENQVVVLKYEQTDLTVQLNAALTKPTPAPIAEVPVKKSVAAAFKTDFGDIVAKVRAKTVLVFGDKHWVAMDNIVKSESNYNPNAVNPNGGACGLPQALPCSKMGSMDVDNQINWMMEYIKNRYGNPTVAWDFHVKNGWY